MIRRPPRSTRVRSSAASDVYKRQILVCQFNQSSAVGNTVIQGKMAEPPPGKTVADFLHQYLVTQPVPILEIHQAQISGYRGCRPAHANVKSLLEGNKETLVIKQRIYLGQFLVHLEYLRR